jgi:hypothetical protein
MPINLKALQQRGVHLEIEYFGEVGEVVYDPVKFTPKFRAEYQQVFREGRAELQEIENANALDTSRPIARLLCMLIRDWDVIGTNGKKVPITEDAIVENLPDAFILHVITEVWADANSLGKSRQTTGLELVS